MVFYNNTNETCKGKSDLLDEQTKKYLDKPIAELELSVRLKCVLQAAGITNIRELVAHTELDMLKYRNFGRKSLNEIKQVLSEMDLQFGMKLD